MDIESYRYEPLPSATAVRLIGLGRGEGDDPLHCRMIVSSLEAEAEYEALSYIWGDVKQRASMTCDGRNLSITKNLAEALGRLRKPDRERTIWADAICINQDDLEEKGLQVRLMAQIYGKAARVLVWLGSEADSCAVAIRFLQRVSRLCCDSVGMSTSEEFLDKVGHLARSNTSLGEYPPVDDPIWQPLVRLFDRPYFNRVWIIQEVLSASAVTGFVGASEFDWADLVLGIRWVARAAMVRDSIILYPRFGGKGYFHAQRLDNGSKLREMSVLELVNFAREFRATNPRDKIYALLDLPSFKGWLAVTPDYTASWGDVYRDFTRRYIEELGSIDILSTVYDVAQSPDDPEAAPKIPSWVPRFNDGKESLYHAGFFPERAAADDTEVSLDRATAPDVLRLGGIIVDRLVRTVRPPRTWTADPATGRNMPGPKEIRDSIPGFPTAAWADVFADKAPYATGEDFVLACAYTLTRGLLADFTGLWDDEALAACRANFAAFLLRWAECHPGEAFLGLPLGDCGEGSRIRSQAASGDWWDFNVAIFRGWRCHKLAVTAKGYLGLAGMGARVGDVCVVLFGGQVPFLLREENGHYTLVGEYLVRGLMEGEAVEMWRRGALEDRMFDIH